jgi:hypothetical protein
MINARYAQYTKYAARAKHEGTAEVLFPGTIGSASGRG